MLNAHIAQSSLTHFTLYCQLSCIIIYTQFWLNRLILAILRVTSTSDRKVGPGRRSLMCVCEALSASSTTVSILTRFHRVTKISWHTSLLLWHFSFPYRHICLRSNQRNHWRKEVRTKKLLLLNFSLVIFSNEMEYPQSLWFDLFFCCLQLFAVVVVVVAKNDHFP